MILEITQDITTNPAYYSDLLNYGVLGIFSAIMIYSIRYLIKEYQKQGESATAAYNKQIDSLNKEKQELSLEKEELTEKFINHIFTNETKLLSIINENSKAYTMVSESNDNVASTINLLVSSINDRNTGTKELNDSIKEIITKNNKI